MNYQPSSISIAIDANEANRKQRVGTGQYTYHLLQHWYQEKQFNFHLYLKHPPVSDLPNVDSHWHYHLVKPAKFWLKFSLPAHFLLHHPHYRSFFAPAHYSPPFLPAPLVVTIHDLAYEHFPNQFLKQDLYKLRRWTQASLAKASRIIAVSQNTKNDLISLYQVNPQKITVIYNGYDKAKFNARIKLNPLIYSKYHLPRQPFILYLGTIQPRKNVWRLVQAFQLLKKDKQYSGKLVLAGNPGWLSEPILQKIHQSPFSQDIYLPGYIDPHDLPSLYKLADLYVLPSLYEGFGLPVLEAMAVGTPVAISDNSSLPEVAGRAGVYFNPLSPDSIRQAILQALSQKDQLRRRGFLQARQFSWEKTARQTLQLLIKL